MLKKSALRRIVLATLVLIILLIIYFFPSNNTYIEESITYINALEMPIFLIDENEYVARTTIIKNSENTDNLIKEIIDSLTVGGIKSSYVPEKFKAVIPQNTKLINFELKDNLLKLNFSKELLNIDAKLEEKMIEAIVFSLMELNDIKSIMIFVEGEQLTKLPHSQKALPQILDKSFGINKIYNIESIKGSTKTTVYYLSKTEDTYYYVPVTEISNHNTERVEVIINNLKSTPIYHTNLISYLTASSNLLSYELLENSITLSFDNHLIANLQNDNILEEVKYSIALSLRDTYDITEVVFNINGKEIAAIAI